MAKPSHRIYQVEDRGKDAKAFWREVGVGFSNSDGSVNLKFSVTPHFAENTVQLRPYEENEGEGEPKSGKAKK